MKSFRTFIKEETTPTSGVSRGVIDVRNPEVRATINAALAAGFGQGAICSPLQALNVARKILANYHIFIPNSNPPASNRGTLVFPADQFGAKVGMNDDGRVVSVEEAPYSIVLKYNVIFGRFWATCEIAENGSINESVEYEEKKISEEPLNELSSGKLANYISKSEKSKNSLKSQATSIRKKLPSGGWNTGQPENVKINDDARKVEKKIKKRTLGQNTAFRKLKNMEESEQLDELSKSTLKSYIKKASHDVATKSAATGRYGDRANAALDRYKNKSSTQPYDDYKSYKFNDEKADKFFKKSWKRRKGIDKAVDKLEEDQLTELSIEKLKDYKHAATLDQHQANRHGALRGNPKQFARWKKRDAGKDVATAKIKQKQAARKTDDSAPSWAQVPKNYRPTIKEQESINEIDMNAMSKKVGQSKNVVDKRGEGAASQYSAYTNTVSRTTAALDKAQPYKNTKMAIRYPKSDPNNLNKMGPIKN